MYELAARCFRIAVTRHAPQRLRLAGLLFVATGVARAQEISVGAPVQLTPAGAGEHTFTSIVADPSDRRHLIVCGYRDSPVQNSWQGFVYASHDAGATWAVALIDSSSRVVSEETCAFGPDGRAYFIAEPWDIYNNPATSELHLYRSPDHGQTWQGPVVGPWLDYARMAVDNTTGPYRGRLYAFGNTKWRGDPDGSTTELLISLDSGRTLAPRVRAPRGPSDTLHNFYNFPERTRVLPSGAVIAAYWASTDTSTSHIRRDSTQGVFVVTARPGGREAASPRRVAPVHSTASRGAGVPSLDVDVSNSKWRGRSYVVWHDSVDARARILLSWSADDGATWSTPRIIDDSPAQVGLTSDRGTSARGPSVAVNHDGVVGVTWAEARGNCWRFSVSTDGGETFRASVPLNVCPRRESADRAYDVNPYAFADNRWKGQRRHAAAGDTTVVGFTIILGNVDFSDGAGYGMTADVNGIFHPLWRFPGQDGRLWTTTINVGSSRRPRADIDLGHLSNVSPHVMPVLTNIAYDDATGIISTDLSLLNADSTRAVEGPVYVLVEQVRSSLGSVKVVGPDSGADQTVAMWEMSQSLPNGRLLPQAVSGVRRMQFRFAKPEGGDRGNLPRDLGQAVGDHRLFIKVRARVLARRFD